MSTFLPISAAKLNKPLRKHALLALATAAAVCLCVPSAGASVVRTAVSSISSGSVSSSQSSSSLTTAIGRSVAPARRGGQQWRFKRAQFL